MPSNCQSSQPPSTPLLTYDHIMENSFLLFLVFPLFFRVYIPLYCCYLCLLSIYHFHYSSYGISSATATATLYYPWLIYLFDFIHFAFHYILYILCRFLYVWTPRMNNKNRTTSHHHPHHRPASPISSPFHSSVRTRIISPPTIPNPSHSNCHDYCM